MSTENVNEELWAIFKPIQDSDEIKQVPKNIEMCSHCNSEDIITNNNEIICETCGTIQDEILSFDAEWRYYGPDDTKTSDPTRCGLPTNKLLPQSSHGSTIAYKWGETYEMRKIRNYHGWHAMPYKERSLYNVFETIQSKALLQGITPCIIEEAKVLYKIISEVKISRGQNRKGIIASCIYKACKIKDVPRSHKEIANIFDISVKHMTRGCKRFDEIMNQIKQENKTSDISGSKSIDYIQRFCSKLNIGENILSICKYTCNKAEEYSLVSENTPPSIAAGTIFLVCSLLNSDISKSQISEICKISEVTISKCYKKLLNHHKHLIPPYILEKLY
jgi:transcription initiation factor TFIIB